MREVTPSAYLEGWPGLLNELRELRLWHWRNAVAKRTWADGESPVEYEADNRTADRHIKFVQTLNDFFPADDTAEKDASK